MTRHARRTIFLNGQDTGLSANTRQQASESLHRVLTRRGRLLSLGTVDQGCTASLGAFNYTLPEPKAK